MEQVLPKKRPSDHVTSDSAFPSGGLSLPMCPKGPSVPNTGGGCVKGPLRASPPPPAPGSCPTSPEACANRRPLLGLNEIQPEGIMVGSAFKRHLCPSPEFLCDQGVSGQAPGRAVMRTQEDHLLFLSFFFFCFRFHFKIFFPFIFIS